MLKDRISQIQLTEEIKKEASRIEAIGFWFQKKKLVALEFNHLIELCEKLTTGTIGTANLVVHKILKIPASIISYGVRNTLGRNSEQNKEYNKLLEIANSKTFENGTVNIKPQSQRGGTREEEEKMNSIKSLGIYEAFAENLDCDVRDKYAFLDYAMTFLKACEDNLFEEVTMSEGTKSNKDKLYDMCMFLHRFWRNNKKIGFFFYLAAIYAKLLKVAMIMHSPYATKQIIEVSLILGKVFKIAFIPFIDRPVDIATNRSDIKRIGQRSIVGEHYVNSTATSLKSKLIDGFDYLFTSNVSDKRMDTSNHSEINNGMNMLSDYLKFNLNVQLVAPSNTEPHNGNPLSGGKTKRYKNCQFCITSSYVAAPVLINGNSTFISSPLSLA
jgi:hypothetical protein